MAKFVYVNSTAYAEIEIEADEAEVLENGDLIFRKNNKIIAGARAGYWVRFAVENDSEEKEHEK